MILLIFLLEKLLINIVLLKPPCAKGFVQYTPSNIVVLQAKFMKDTHIKSFQKRTFLNTVI